MPEDIENEESLQIEILKELLIQLQKYTVFDSETLEKLKILLLRGELKKAAKVMDAIKPKGGE